MRSRRCRRRQKGALRDLRMGATAIPAISAIATTTADACCCSSCHYPRAESDAKLAEESRVAPCRAATAALAVSSSSCSRGSERGK